MEFKALLTVDDVMQITGLGRASVYQLLNRADMPVVQIGRRKYMHRDRFIAWLDEQSRPQVEKGA